jgi:hypothetical protein
MATKHPGLFRPTLRLTLKTSDGRTGVEDFGLGIDGGMQWSREDGDGHTLSATFETLAPDGSTSRTFVLSGGDWRHLESNGNVTDVDLLLRHFTSDLERAVDQAMEGSWPVNFDGEMARRIDELEVERAHHLHAMHLALPALRRTVPACRDAFGAESDDENMPSTWDLHHQAIQALAEALSEAPSNQAVSQIPGLHERPRA